MVWRVRTTTVDRPGVPTQATCPTAPNHEAFVRLATVADVPALAEMHERCAAETRRLAYGAPLARMDGRLARLLVAGAGALVVQGGEGVVGVAALSEVDDGRCELVLMVEDGWQGQGWGTRLLAGAVGLAAGSGASEVELRGPARSPAAVAMVFSSGLRARMRLLGDELVVTVSARGFCTTRDAATGAGACRVPEPA